MVENFSLPHPNLHSHPSQVLTQQAVSRVVYLLYQESSMLAKERVRLQLPHLTASTTYIYDLLHIEVSWPC